MYGRTVRLKSAQSVTVFIAGRTKGCMIKEKRMGLKIDEVQGRQNGDARDVAPAIPSRATAFARLADAI